MTSDLSIHGRGKKILYCLLVLQTSTPKFLLVLLPTNARHSRKYKPALYFFTCPSDIGRKYMLVLFEILLVPGSRTRDFFTPGL